MGRSLRHRWQTAPREALPTPPAPHRRPAPNDPPRPQPPQKAPAGSQLEAPCLEYVTGRAKLQPARPRVEPLSRIRPDLTQGASQNPSSAGSPSLRRIGSPGASSARASFRRSTGPERRRNGYGCDTARQQALVACGGRYRARRSGLAGTTAGRQAPVTRTFSVSRRCSRAMRRCRSREVKAVRTGAHAQSRNDRPCDAPWPARQSWLSSSSTPQGSQLTSEYRAVQAMRDHERGHSTRRSFPASKPPAESSTNSHINRRTNGRWHSPATARMAARHRRGRTERGFRRPLLDRGG